MAVKKIMEIRCTPFKLVAMICGIVNVILLIASICGQWIYDDMSDVNERLWDNCRNSHDKDCYAWLSAVQALLILSILLDVVGTWFVGWGYFKDYNTETKWINYRIAMGLFCGALLFALISLAVYLGMTQTILPMRTKGNWHIGWGHGLGWGSILIYIVIIILLILPTEKDTSQKSPQRGKSEVKYYDNYGHM